MRVSSGSASAVVVAFFLLSVSALPTFGQQAAGLAEPVSGTAGDLQKAPAMSVGERADALVHHLRDTREKIADQPEITRIATSLSERLATLSTASEEVNALLGLSPTLTQLGEVDREWSHFRAETYVWRHTIDRHVASIDAALLKLSQSETDWTEIRATTSVEDSPREIHDAIRRSLDEIFQVQTEATRRRAEIAALQTGLAQLEILVFETLDGVKVARRQIRNRLLEPDRPPIWSTGGQGEGATSIRVPVALAAQIAILERFVEERGRRFMTLAVFFLLSAFATFGLKRSIEARQAAGGEIEKSSEVFLHPIALAVFISLLAVHWMFPLAPGVVRDGVALLLLVPLLGLLPSLLHPGLRPMLYGVAVFFVVDRLRGMLEGAVFEGRIAFAVECLAASVFCFSLLRPSRIAQIPDPEHFPSWPSYTLRFGAIAFTIAFFANILGYVTLAMLIGQGLLTTVYLGIGVYAGVRVLGIILNVTTNTGWTKKIHFLRARRAVAVNWIKRVISILAFGLWAYWSLDAFAIQVAVLDRVYAILTAPVTLGTFSASLADAIAFGLTIAAAIVISRIVRFVLLEDVFPRMQTARGIPNAVSSTAHYLILFGGFLLAAAAAGIDFSKFTLLAGAFGVGIGFGLQNVVNNFVSGIILLFERPVQVGDAIDLGDLIGHVKRIGIRSSTIRALNGSGVIVPNADLISQRVINWTLSDKHLRIIVPIGVKYGTDPEAVLELLRGVASNCELVLEHPAPLTLFRGHGESSLDFELRVWIANFDDWFKVESAVNTAINRALKTAGIEIPFPQRDLHLRSVDRDAARLIAPNHDES